MAQQIGLEATFDLSGWSANQKKYVSGLDQASSATDKAAGGMGKAWGQLGSSVTKTTAILGGAVVGAAALAGAAIAKFTGDGISKAIELDQKMADIAAIMGKTRAEIEPLNKLIIDLGIDPNLKVSAAEAAAAIEMLAANGLTMTEIMDGAAKATVLLANATGAEFDVAANIATDAMAIFNIEAADMIEAVNGITAVTVASKFGIDDYRLALAQGGGVAASAGVSFDDFNTSIAAISPLFASGSDAGTSFKTMINSLTPNSKEAAKVMKQLGLEFYDASGQMKSMAEISTELNDAMFQEVTFTTEVNNATAEQTETKKMLEAQIKKTNMELYKYEVGLNGVAQSEADKLVSIDRLNRQHDAAVQAYQNLAIAQGTTITNTRTLTEEERAKALETIFGADATRAAIGIAEAGQVVYTDLAKAVAETGLAQELLSGFMKDGELTAFELTQAQMGLTDANAQAATRMDTVAGAMEIFSGVVETLQIQIGQAFLPIIRAMVEMFTTFVTQHSPAIIAAFQAFAENVVALGQYLFYATTEGETMNDWLTEMHPILATVVIGTLGLVDGLMTLGGWIGNTVGKFIEWQDVLIVLGGIIASIVLPAIWGMIAAMAPAIGMFALAVGAVAAVRLAWENDFLGIQTTVTGAINAIIEAFEPLTSAITEFGSGALAEIKAFATGNATEFENLKAIWEGAKESVNNLFTTIVTAVQTNLPTWTANLREWGLVAVQWIIDAHAQAIAAITQFITALVGLVSSNLPTWKAAFVEWATAAWQWIVDAAGEVAAKLGEWYSELSGYVASKLPEWKTGFLEWATAAWQWLLDAARELNAKVGEWFSSLRSALDAKLPEWRNAFLEWRDATWQWLVDSATDLPGKINAWFNSLREKVTAKLPTLKTEMLKFATALVEWIGDEAADALPKLGEWLGKILAWIPKGVAALAIGLIELGKILVSWITGPEADPDPEMEKFKAALGQALKDIGTGLKGFLREFTKAFMEELGIGFLAEQDGISKKLKQITDGMIERFQEIDWQQIGIDILAAVIDGIESMKDAVFQRVEDIVKGMIQGFKDSINDFIQIGKDMIQGVIDGFNAMKQTLLDKVAELANLVPQWMKDLLGIASPSKVMASIGVQVIQGLISGMESMKSHLRSSVGSLVGGLVAGVQGRILAGSRNMLTELGKLSSDFMSAAGEWADAVQALTGDGTEDNPAAAALEMLGAQQGITDSLQRQLKLVELIRAAGKDPAQFLGAGGALGRNADPVYMMNLLTEAAEAFNDQLENQLRIAALGYDTLINDLRSERQEIAEIEDLALRPTLRGVDFIRQQIDDLDSQIAKAEQSLLNTGQAVYAEQLRQLHTMRQMRAAELSDYIKLWHQVEQTVEQAAGFAESLTNERGAEAARRFVDNHIRPLMDMIQTPGATMDQRNVWLSMINERMGSLVQYERSLRILTTLQERLNVVTGDSRFGATIAKNIQPFLDVLYDPMLTGADRNKLFNTLSTYQTRIAGLLSTFNRLGTHSVFGDLSTLMTPYLNRLLDVNLAEDERNRLTAEYLRINSRLQTAQALDQATVSLNDRLDLLNKIKALSAEMGSDSVLRYIIGDVDLMKGLSPEQFAGIYQRYSEQAVAAASAALRKALMPDLTKEFNKVVGDLRSFDQIMKEFDQTPTSDLERAQQYLAYYDAEIERLRALAAAGHQAAIEQGKATKARRDQAVAWIREYMDALFRADQHVARIQETTDERAVDIAETFRENLIDPLRALMEKNIGADYRKLLITQIGQRVDQLNSYVRQIASLSTLQKDLSDALGFNPLVARFAEMKLDPILAAIYDINTSEAERLRLVTLYRQEQEKILRIQEKVQQLEFLNMQLDLLKQITQLNEEFGEQVPLSDILKGIKFGMGASLDDLLTFVSRAIDSIIRVTNHELGISSPSKVFARIGSQMMDGMTMGIQSSIMQPIGMLRSAISDIPYAMQGRSLAVNMGGVTINNGMDDVMFEARVRQIVQREFN